MNLRAIGKFHKTRLGYLVFGIVELGLTYVFASLAVTSGSLWQWVLTIILLVGFFQNLIRLIGKLIYGNRSEASRA